MKIVSRTPTSFLMLGAALALVLAACNNVGSCPKTITPGASCSGDNLECPYTIQTTSSMCSSLEVDGAVATSCTCTGGVWSCPACTADDGGEEAGSDATTEDGSADGGQEGSTEASADGPAESSSTDSSATDAAHD